MNETKFDGMGKGYAQFRPSYPQTFLDYLYSKLLFDENAIIADIGAGTGILTRQLLERGSKVFAVEPNTDMRVAAEKELSSFANFVSINGTAEDTTLADDSTNFITVAQAFHWFDEESFKVECKRILKQDGMVVLVWNTRDETSPLVRDNNIINQKYCCNFKGFSGGMKSGEGDFSSFFKGDYETMSFANNLAFDEASFIGRSLSASYTLKEEDERYHEYIEELKALFKKYSINGRLIMPNMTKSYAGSM